MLTARTRVLGEDAPAALPAGCLVAATILAATFVAQLEPRVAAPEGDGATAAAAAAVPAATDEAIRPVAPSARPAPPVATADAPAAAPASCPPVRVAFRSGAAATSPPVAARLRELGAAIAAVPDAAVVVDGHADSLGSDDLNLMLSKRRAEAIAWAIERGGLSRTRITSRGFGAFTPVEGADADADVNRQAVIHVRAACPCGFSEVLGP